MVNYNLTQKIKTLEKLFEEKIDSEQKIKNLKWEQLKAFNPIEKSFIMDLKEAISKRKIIEFLANKENNEEEKTK